MARRLALILLLQATPAFAGDLTLPTVPHPTDESPVPRLWFSPAELPELRSRKARPRYDAYFASTRSFVDGRLAALASAPTGLDDDALSKLAKGAAFLHQLDELPAASFPTYADAAVQALVTIRSRSPQIFVPPTDAIHVLQDSPRLQSMVEAHDMLRGTAALDAGSDAAIRSRIAEWANALRDDANLKGLPPLVEGHRDNWGLKAGAALTTAGLGLSLHDDAASWIDFANVLISESLARVASDTGWYREGPHYINYSLNGLASAAHHVRAVTGVDWFAAMKPWAEAALAMRLPDGSMAPLEEGVRTVFPFDVLAGSYPALGPEMAWAWEESDRNSTNYTNQALHSVTRFIMVDDDTVATEPAGSPTRFLGEDAHVHVMRTDWGPNALQALMITARDHDDTLTFDSRHHMQNPLDITLAAEGELVLVTASGGPEVTSSANRDHYLLPSSKNIPLVDGTAPFITDETLITSGDRIDSQDTDTLLNPFADTATTTVTAYPGADAVKRTLALIDESYIVIADELVATSAHDYTLGWRGRGQRTVELDTTEFQRVNWEHQGGALDLSAAATAPIELSLTDGLYADSWGNEEDVQAVSLLTHGSRVLALSVFEPRELTDDLSVVTRVGEATSVGLQLERGDVKDLIVHGAVPFNRTVGSLSTDARLCVVRTVGEVVTAFTMLEGSYVTHAGAELCRASATTSLSLTISPGGFVAELTSDRPVPPELVFGALPGLDLSQRHDADLNGTTLAGPDFVQRSDSFTFTSLPGSGTLRVENIGVGFLGQVGNTLRLSNSSLSWGAAAGATNYKVRRAELPSFMSTQPIPDDTHLWTTVGALTVEDVTPLPAAGLFCYFVNATDGMGLESSN